jgi:hypothetical protein
VQLENKIFLPHFYNLAKMLQPRPCPTPHPHHPHAGLDVTKKVAPLEGGKLAMVGMFVLCVLF